MKIKNKNILILGLGISGVSSAKALIKLGANVTINDSKSKEELKEYVDELKGFDIEYRLGTNDIDLSQIDFIIKSPGIPLDIIILKNARVKNIEIMTDIELAYRISSNKFIALTGTNGKTTTTTLVGEILKESGKTTHVTGNIGVGILWEIVNSQQNDIFIIETSSFQLESTQFFKPDISVILNITPDHLKWHETFENYVNAKKKIYANQVEDDFTILNYDDEILKKIDGKLKSNVLYFSSKYELEKGVYVENEHIVINDGDKKTKLMKFKDIKIPGRHNLENALASICIAWLLDIDNEIIVKTLMNFEGIEHRLEYVDTINGMKFYNDSKGTNPTSSIKAIEAIDSPIILIAGGYDKGSDFFEFVDSFNGKVSSLILLGETKEKIKETALSLGLSNIYIVDTMKDAVLKSMDISNGDETILLSPACASWDMYNSYEERGKDFKNCIKTLRGLLYGQKGCE